MIRRFRKDACIVCILKINVSEAQSASNLLSLGTTKILLGFSSLLILPVCMPNLTNSSQSNFYVFYNHFPCYSLPIFSSPKSFPVVFLLPNVLFTLEGTLCFMTFSCFFKAPGSNRITQYQMTFCTDFAVKAKTVGCQKQSLLQLFSLYVLPFLHSRRRLSESSCHILMVIRGKFQNNLILVLQKSSLTFMFICKTMLQTQSKWHVHRGLQNQHALAKRNLI